MLKLRGCNGIKDIFISVKLTGAGSYPSVNSMVAENSGKFLQRPLPVVNGKKHVYIYIYTVSIYVFFSYKCPSKWVNVVISPL